MQVLIVFLSVTFALSLGAKLPLGGIQNFDIQQRIQNGKDADKEQFPYIVSLLIREGNDSDVCGGSIIGHNWILTAAHCTHYADWVQIFYGSTEKWKGVISHVVSPDNIIEHEHYNNRTHENDIALIRTPHVEYSELVKKVSLADRDNDYVEAWAVASGWGGNEHGIAQEDLQFVGVQIYSKQFWLDFAGRPSDTIICGGSLTGQPTGVGDSGGPLVTDDDAKLIGVTSFARIGYSTCFTRVSAYLDWIRGRTGLK